MDKFKNRMYNYEVDPPGDVWRTIARKLDEEEPKVVPMRKRKLLYYSLAAAAAIAVIIFCVIFFNRSSDNEQQIVSSPSENPSSDQKNKDSSVKNEQVIITVPEPENPSTKKKEQDLANNIPLKGPNEKIVPEEKKIKDTAQTAVAPADEKNPGYITIANEQGQTVKVSAKILSLIDSSGDKNPTKPPVWNKKINEWKEIMKGNTLAVTPGNFLDIIELTKSLKEKNK